MDRLHGGESSVPIVDVDVGKTENTYLAIAVQICHEDLPGACWKGL
jgi:hypothetical protein